LLFFAAEMSFAMKHSNQMVCDSRWPQAGILWLCLIVGCLWQGRGANADEGAAVNDQPPATIATEEAQDAPPRPQRRQVDNELSAPPAERSNALPTQDDTIAHARALSRAFRDSAQKALPSVVTVYSRSKRSSESSNPVLNIIGGERAQKFDSVGSGVIIQSDGLILTNHHVVADAVVIEVLLQDGRQFKAEALQSDLRSDVAILKIEVSEALPAAKIGKSNDLYVGDWVLAIGSPFMIEASVSAGIISGTGRYQQLSRNVQGQFLQTDAAINPGNSGGPLLDLEGQVVGINTAISSRTGGFEGIGFAIPIDRAMWIKNELLQYKHVRRGFAGVSIASVPHDLATSLDLPSGAGALVNSVTPDRPGDLAGLKRGDVILEFSGGRVQSNSGFAELVQQSPIGEPLPMTIIRDGKRMQLTMELVEHP
jgi:serine protease Do